MKRGGVIILEDVDILHIRIPIYNNYILYAASYLCPEYFLRYQFTDYHRGLERGVGLCDQHTIILDGILKSQDIESMMVDTPHHFFETALADPATNEWWILDPDYGVVISHSIQQIKENPELIREAYLRKGYSNETVDRLIKDVWKNPDFKTHTGISDYSKKLYPFEQAAYILVWIIPVLLMLPLTIDIFCRAVRKYRKKKQ